MAGERRPMGHASFRRTGEHKDFSHSHEHRQREDETWYDAECSKCHESFRVPFEPAPDRPVYCRNCLRTTRDGASSKSRRDFDGESKPQELYDIVCSHCGKQDQVPFRPYEGSVVLCRECMANPNVERVGGKIYHTIICSVCGKENRVPFKPDPGSRVLCRECHMAERAEKQRSLEYYAKNHPSVINQTKVRIEIRCDKCGATDVLPFLPKTHGPILCRQCAENTFGEEWARRNRVAAREYPFTCARCAAQDFVPFKPKPGQELLCKHCLNDEAILTHKRDEMQRHDRFTCVRPAKHKPETPDSDK